MPSFDVSACIRRRTVFDRVGILLLLLVIGNEWNFVESHFIWSRVGKTVGGENDEVQVFFSEPVAIADSSLDFLDGRVKELKIIEPSSPTNPDSETATIVAVTENSEEGYLSGTLPASLSPPDTVPRFVTGFLDYGDFGRGGPVVDLQYTFSAQTFSTNPSDDWMNFYHNLEDMAAYADAFPGEQPFAIALRNYGPPYEVVVRGVSEDSTINVCLYEGNGREVGCVEGTTKGKNHLMIDSIGDSEVLKPCETYFALANTTGTDAATNKPKSLWSSTSVTWDGPCARDSNRNGSNTGASFGASSLGSFASGFLVCLIIVSIKNVFYKTQKTKIGRSKIASARENEGGYTDNAGSLELA